MAFLVLRGISKNLISMIFGIIFLVFSFWIILMPSVSEAAVNCRTSCNDVAVWDVAGIINCGGNSGCFYSDASHIDPDPVDGGACSVRKISLRLCNPINFVNPSCNDANMSCKEDNCSGLTANNGADCVVTMGKGGAVACGPSVTKSGKWDASEGKCVECSGLKESTVCADGSSIKLSNTTGVCNASNNSFETACSATVSSVCDDKVQGAICSPPAGGSCNASGECAVTAACDTNPTVEIIPASQNGVAGTAKVYTIKITNNDDAACATASRTFNLTSAKPGAAWGNSFSATTITAAKGGGSNTVNYTLTSPVGASEQPFPFQISATDSNGANTALGVYTITTCSANTFIKFETDKYKKGSTLKIRFGIAAAEPTNDYARCVYNNTGNNKWDSPIAHFGGSADLGSNVNTAVGNTLGTWTTSLVAGTASCPGVPSGCIGATKVVECLVDADCASNDCDLTTNACVAAAGCTAGTCNGTTQYCSGGSWVNCSLGQTCSAGVCSGSGTPSCPGNRDACEALVPNLALPCNCGTVTINSGESKYCCGATKGVFSGDAAGLSACQTACSAAACVPATCSGCADGTACPGGTCSAGACVVPASVASCSGSGMFVSPLGPGYCTIGEILEKATGWILSLVASIIILILIIGGLMYISSAGDEEKIRTSKNIILYAIIGLGIILISYALITEVEKLLKGT